jgi:hypothetical protein
MAKLSIIDNDNFRYINTNDKLINVHIAKLGKPLEGQEGKHTKA